MGALGYLLDTHTFLWAVHDESNLSFEAKKAIMENPSKVYVSAVSAYEIMNKYRIGKLPEYAYLAENYFDILHEFGANELQISTKHTHFAGKFEWSHRDPFDRLLAAQTFTEDFILIATETRV
jgi:PIN domain nuclease of toxin-antitoxin system